jgi:hypothetical protein
MSKASKSCIVVYDDEQGICAPLGWDTDCEGALCCVEPVVVFPDRNAARKAINVSARYNDLCREQGKSNRNTDFDPECRPYIRIKPAAIV